jgi:predicted dehydrogenase
MASVTAIVVGTGDYARYHIGTILDRPESTEITGLVNRAGPNREATRALFAVRSRPCPPFYDTLGDLFAEQGAPDAALICTPHRFHFENARDCLERGSDVFLEKPMVMNAGEASDLIRRRDRSGRLVVVAFPGSLSPAIRQARAMIGAGALGRVSAIAAFVHQNWKQNTAGTWRQVPELSGGGFLFDTGSHMINTVIDLLGDEIAEVSARLDPRGTRVDINASVRGATAGGVLFSLLGAGDSVHCHSQIDVFGDRGVLRTGIWGERLLFRSAEAPDFAPVPVPSSRGAWDEFLRVRRGEMENPCPPEIGLRFALVMDMIRKSAAAGGAAVTR